MGRPKKYFKFMVNGNAHRLVLETGSVQFRKGDYGWDRGPKWATWFKFSELPDERVDGIIKDYRELIPAQRVYRLRKYNG